MSARMILSPSSASGDQHCPQSIRRDDQSLDWFACACIDNAGRRELRKLAQECSDAMGDNVCAVA